MKSTALVEHVRPLIASTVQNSDARGALKEFVASNRIHAEWERLLIRSFALLKNKAGSPEAFSSLFPSP